MGYPIADGDREGQRMAVLIGSRIKAAGKSDVGCVRTLNEDSFRIDPEAGLLIVADGMGGHDAGEVASAEVVEAIREFLGGENGKNPARTITNPPMEDDTITMTLDDLIDSDEEATLDDLPNPLIATVTAAIAHANTKVNAINRKKGYPDGMGMGSTLVGLWYTEIGEQPVVFNVGDSRLYLMSRGRLIQITQDHTLFEQWTKFGGKGDSPAKNILLQAMGPSRRVTPDVRFQYLGRGDLVLLCSDGLTGMIPDKNIEEILREAREDNLDELCQLLIDQAKSRGGKDNVTVILGYVIK